ncbi:MAG: hypothetical protein NDI94_01480 [Candidatus Woesearchaeota archaeon]|nr:hypothetical protein [Candidatus Woesearchaeota archaeon]
MFKKLFQPSKLPNGTAHPKSLEKTLGEFQIGNPISLGKGMLAVPIVPGEDARVPVLSYEQAKRKGLLKIEDGHMISLTDEPIWIPPGIIFSGQNSGNQSRVPRQAQGFILRKEQPENIGTMQCAYKKASPSTDNFVNNTPTTDIPITSRFATFQSDIWRQTDATFMALGLETKLGGDLFELLKSPGFNLSQYLFLQKLNLELARYSVPGVRAVSGIVTICYDPLLAKENASLPIILAYDQYGSSQLVRRRGLSSQAVVSRAVENKYGIGPIENMLGKNGEEHLINFVRAAIATDPSNLGYNDNLWQEFMPSYAVDTGFTIHPYGMQTARMPNPLESIPNQNLLIYASLFAKLGKK